MSLLRPPCLDRPRLSLLTLLVVALLGVSRPAVAQNEPWWDAFVSSNAPDARIHALAVMGDTLYCAGQFTTVAGQPASYVVGWDGTSWFPLGSGMDAQIEDLAIHAGQLIAVGPFTTAGGVPANRVARWDGSSWHAMGAGTSGYGESVLSFNGTLVVGAGGQVQAWNGTAWTAWGGQFDGAVRSLGVHAGDLYAGGDFTQHDATVVNHIARWDGSTWQPVGGGTSLSSIVWSIGTWNGQLVIAGSFADAGGGPVGNIATWTGSAWQAMAGGTNGLILDILEHRGRLFATGQFTVAGGVPAVRIAAWDGAAWAPLGSGLNATGFILREYRETLYAGGGFTQAGGKDSYFLARWREFVDCNGNGIDDLADIAAMTVPDCNANGTPDSCDIASGASFDCDANGVPDECDPDCDNDGIPNACEAGAGVDCNGNSIDDECDLAQSISDDCDGNGVPDECDPDCDGDDIPDACEPNESWWDGLGVAPAPELRVQSMAVVDSTLYACGQFAGGVARWNGLAWESLNLFPTNNVEVLATWRGQLVAVGHFTAIDGVAADNVAVFDGQEWSALGSGLPSNGRTAIEFQGDLFVGTGSGAYRWNGTTWTNTGLGSGGWSFCVWNGELYSHAARWTGSAWQPLGGAGPNGRVFAMCEFQDRLVLAGEFTTIDGIPFAGIASWDGVSYAPFGTGLDGLYPTAQGLVVYQNRLLVTGLFSSAGGEPASAIAAWDGAAWRPMGAGLAGGNPLSGGGPWGWCFAPYRGFLYVGGNFTQAGGKNSRMFARWGGCTDCNGNGIPDRTEIDLGQAPDENGNGLPDECDIASGVSDDCNANGVPDEAEPDCDSDGLPNDCETFIGGTDCNGNAVPDSCDIASGTADCDGNGVPDACQPDCDGDGIPNVCESQADCNANGIQDHCDIFTGYAEDCDGDGVPDSCQPDCDNDGVPNVCESTVDCDGNGTPDHCDIAAGTGDCDANGVPDACQPDSDRDGEIDICEILNGAADCNENGVPDSSDVFPGDYGSTEILAASTGPYRDELAAGDFDRDGWPDLVYIGDSYWGNDLNVIWNESGTGWTWTLFGSGTNPRCLAVGDFNGDTFLDIAWGVGFSVFCRLGTGTRTFGDYLAKDFDLVEQEFGRSMLPLRADGDNRTDLVWIRDERAAIAIVRGSELTGQAVEPDFLQIPVTTEPALQRIAVGDLNGDGLDDIVLANSAFGTTPSGFYYLLAGGGGNYAAPVHVDAPMPVYALGCGDLNGDGRDDVVLEGTGATPRYLMAWLSNNVGGFTYAGASEYFVSGPWPFDLALADFDRDGRLDVALKTGRLALGNGDGTFQSPAKQWETTGNWGWMVPLDYDQDGWTDLADFSVGNDTFGNTYYSWLSVFRNEIIPAGPAADENGDGVPDECQVASVEPPAGASEPGLRLLGPGSNPVRGSAILRFESGTPRDVRLTLHDLTGRLVRTWNWKALPAGSHAVNWDGRDAAGTEVPAGVYFVRVEGGGEVRTSKFVRVR